ncbi:MFS transporter [Citricoccus muralis]|uniref:Putative MFS family arabinose efflux permease n=1 Tax=Citricoccus muralis TaxID=169134 RepID=A0A3D9LE50_9MICC|nr:MFS transporter [Citricoccus muralis]REE04140.1 putative MFS family arabinose efflux permease [Citricoccus muralis]
MSSASSVPQPPQLLWSRNFILAAVTNLFIAMVFYLLVTAMALYAVNEFQATEILAGLAVSAFVLGAVVSRLFTGQAMDIIGRKRVLVTSLALFLMASALYLVADDLGLLITVRLFHGLAFGGASTVLAAAVQGMIPPRRRSEGTGWFGTSTTVGTALGPLLAFQLTDRFGFDSLFYLCAAFSVCGLVAGLVVRLPRAQHHQQHGVRPRFSLRGLVSLPALPVSLVMLMAGLAYSGVLAFLNGYAQEQGISPTIASAFFMVYAVVLVLSRFVVGTMQDRYGDNSVVFPLLTCLVAGMAVLALWPANGGFLVAAALCALGFGALLTSLQSVAATVVPPFQIGVATSTYFLMLDIGTGLGPVVLGALLPATGFSGMYLMLSGFLVLAMVVYWFAHGRRRAGGATTPSAPRD